ncbi:MAG TPA: hypothetical protein VEX60_02075 [Pyrinomonadaceae bacterium]|nr:hypothetical protein [Pyrinomonadaceae bacterium]
MSTDTTAIPIYQGQEFYVPAFEVKLRGRLLDKDVVRDIVQVSYKDSLQEVDSFEITINNWDAEKRSFKYIDDTIFDPGKEIELWMGYFGKDKLRLMIKGEITSLRPNFPATGQPTLAISGLNLIHRMRTKQESHTYVRQTDSSIAQEVGKRLKEKLGVTVETNPLEKEERYDYVLQDNKYDIIFLMERARRVGYDIFVKESSENDTAGESKLYFGKSDGVKRVTYQLSFGKSLVEFQPELSTAMQVGKVTVFGWDNKKKERIKYTATRKELRTKGVGSKGRQGAVEQSFGDREEIIADRPVNSLNEAKKLAVETLEQIAKEMLKGRGTVVGLPDLRAGGVVMIDGMGDRFSGRYFLTGTTHSITDAGYTTQFECRREEL